LKEDQDSKIKPVDERYRERGYHLSLKPQPKY